MKSRNQYLEELIRKNGGYHLKSKKDKTKLLDEYCQVVGQNRDYVIRKLRKGLWVYQERRKKQKKQRKRKSYYDSDVKSALIKCWKIFDCPCGQWLETLLKQETDRLMKDNELFCSFETAEKLKKISSRTIDEKLRGIKEKENTKRKYDYRNNPLLYNKIPVKLSTDWDRNEYGNIQIDMVEHCGSSNYGEYIYTLSTTDIHSGWWEGDVQFGKSMNATVINMDEIISRYPEKIREMHPDNGSEFINQQLYLYAKKNKIRFSRSRPYHKNDNCFVEQKNSTHVRRIIGHLRYDTKKELELINDMYCNELRFYKNFFQPIIKLVSKERIGGYIKRKYDKPKTPYQRIMENCCIARQKKDELQKIYESLNPAELKREIDRKTKLLKEIYDAKHGRAEHQNTEELNIISPTFLNRLTKTVSPT